MRTEIETLQGYLSLEPLKQRGTTLIAAGKQPVQPPQLAAALTSATLPGRIVE